MSCNFDSDFAGKAPNSPIVDFGAAPGGFGSPSEMDVIRPAGVLLLARPRGSNELVEAKQAANIEARHRAALSERKTTYNESLSVKNDSQQLFLEPLGMSTLRRGNQQNDKLSMEGAAEFYWDLFIEPLQRD